MTRMRITVNVKVRWWLRPIVLLAVWLVQCANLLLLLVERHGVNLQVKP